MPQPQPPTTIRKTRGTVAPATLQALSTLSTIQMEAVASLISREAERITLRDAMLVRYRRLLQAGRSAAADARQIEREVRQDDRSNPHAAVLHVIRALSRDGGALGAKAIERALCRAD